MERIGVIIVAGGSGRRMGGSIPKQFRLLGGQPVLARTIGNFAAAWPASIHKSWASRTRKGKSLAFMMIVLVGYIAGIAKVLVSHTAIYMLIPYTLNTTLVLCDLALYYRNYRIDSGLHVPF